MNWMTRGTETHRHREQQSEEEGYCGRKEKASVGRGFHVPAATGVRPVSRTTPTCTDPVMWARPSSGWPRGCPNLSASQASLQKLLDRFLSWGSSRAAKARRQHRRSQEDFLSLCSDLISETQRGSQAPRLKTTRDPPPRIAFFTDCETSPSLPSPAGSKAGPLLLLCPKPFIVGTCGSFRYKEARYRSNQVWLPQSVSEGPSDPPSCNVLLAYLILVIKQNKYMLCSLSLFR